MADKGRDIRTGRFTRGNKAALKHGAYRVQSRKETKKPSIRGARALRRYLERLQAELETKTPQLNAKKQILINQIIACEEKRQLMDMWLRKIGLLIPEKLCKQRLELQPCLSFYISIMNTQRQAILALGLDFDQARRLLSPLEIVQSEEQKKD